MHKFNVWFSFMFIIILSLNYSGVLNASTQGKIDHINRKISLLIDHKEWEGFKLRYSKKYSCKDEESYRKSVYFKNKAKIARLNEKNRAQIGENAFGINKFTDLEEKEFMALYLTPNMVKYMAKIGNIKPADFRASIAQLPSSFNWEDQGAITPLKDQGQCGSCWAFSATEMVESMAFLVTGTLPILSAQQIVSCDRNDDGCDGGLPSSAFDYIHKYGQEADSTYPYTSGSDGYSGKCTYKASEVAAHISGWQYIIPQCSNHSCSNQVNYEPKLQNYIANTGPASIAVNASSWQFYTGGIVAAANCSGTMYSLNHAVQLIGYDVSGSIKYWVVRNQWGDWGENGNIRLAMGDNTCGMANVVTTPTGVSL